ncbi:MAG: hypothetical protein KAH01_05930 [Caldisericia bacterium]|nr:hypothetical protein [Caldisericia bacterium]
MATNCECKTAYEIPDRQYVEAEPMTIAFKFNASELNAGNGDDVHPCLHELFGYHVHVNRITEYYKGSIDEKNKD